jgi:hypothetical protein
MPLLSTFGAASAGAFGFGKGLPKVGFSFLIVSGGASGGTGESANYRAAGVGGAGGLLADSSDFISGNQYTITVGAGSGGLNPPTAGGVSSISGTGLTTISPTAGGPGASAGSDYSRDGGSGGGGAVGGEQGSGSIRTPGSAVSGQGNDGGTAFFSSSTLATGGGGGGADSAGSNAGNGSAGSGGNGFTSSITGSSVTYAGGGGGGYGGSGSGASGGSGGGGKGAGSDVSDTAVSGSANTGGGGGGGGGTVFSGRKIGAFGGSGIVILSIPTSDYTGTVTGSPTVTTSGNNTILQFNSSGTYTA